VVGAEIHAQRGGGLMGLARVSATVAIAAELRMCEAREADLLTRLRETGRTMRAAEGDHFQAVKDYEANKVRIAHLRAQMKGEGT
jgi:hypothetical protein